MPTIIDGTLGLTTPTYGGADTSEYIVPVTSFKNRIINGNMSIDQRNAGASVTISDTGNFTFVIDRWSGYGNITSKFSLQRNAGSVTPPAGFTNYLGATSLSAYSVTGSDNFTINQPIEGFNCADLGWGTANAKTITISFWVRSSLTGTFGGVVNNSAYNRCYPFTYTISSANTWEQKSVTIAGDTSGTWETGNGIGILVRFSLGAGSTGSGTAGAWTSTYYYSATGATSVVGTNGATFYITGVQLEVGSTATSFDYRPYGTELALCQRYYQTNTGSVGVSAGSTNIRAMINFSVQMRASPTLNQSGVLSFTDGYAADYSQSSASAVIDGSGARVSTSAVIAFLSNYSGLTSSRWVMQFPQTNAFTLSAEL